MFGILAFGLMELLLFSMTVAVIDTGLAYLALRVFQREEILVSWR